MTSRMPTRKATAPLEPARSVAALVVRAALVLVVAVTAVGVSIREAGSHARAAASGSVPAPESERGAARLVLELKPQAEVTGPTIRIGDVAAYVEGDAGLWESVSRLEVGAAPLPGESRSLSKASVILRLRQARIDPGLIRWNTQVEATSVSVPGRSLQRSRVLQALSQYLASQPGPDGWPPLSVLDVEVPEGILVPPGDVQLAVVSGPPVLRPGAAVFALDVSVDGASARRVWVRATLGASGSGQEAPAGGGRVPAYPTEEGGPVVSGALVTVLVRRGSVTVELPGVVQGAARVGESVQVRNPSSGAVLNAVLVRPDLALVELPGEP